MKRLTGKVAIITGSSSGIGKAIALKFGEEGARVVISARRGELCEQVANRIQERGGEALAIPADVNDEAQVDRLVTETARSWGRLDILVNNAGMVAQGRIADVSTELFDQVLNTNLRGTFFCCRSGFRQMMQQQPEGGLIINMSSVAGVQSWAGTGIYSASKHGIMALTKALADEGRQYNIKASAICPGRVADDLVDASAEEIERTGKISPFDVAETAVYLSTLGPNTIVHQVIMDRTGADW
jgi:3-oxoacyl-[acyl-carrier protein] reductase